MKKYTPRFIPQERYDKILSLIGRDFIERDGASFVYQDNKNQGLRWQDAVGEGESLSEVFLAMTDREEIILRAYDIARDTVDIMSTGVRPRIVIDPEGRTTKTGCTDGKSLYVCTKMFDDADLSAGEAADIFIGLSAHEGCHLKWTDFNVLKHEVEGRLLHHIHNIVEDERIEHLLGSERPALAGFLKATKYYFFDKHKEPSEDGTEPESNPTSELVKAVFSLIRYPKNLTNEDIDRWGEALAEVRAVLDTWPSDTRSAVKTAQAILDIILRYAPLDDEDQQDEGEEGNGGGDGQEGGEGGKGKGRAISRDELEERIKGLLDRLDEIEKDSDGTSADNVSDAVKDDPFIQGRAEGTCRRETGGDNKHPVETISDPVVPSSENRYRESYERVRAFIPPLRNALMRNATAYTETLRGLRSGALDTGRLAEAYQGAPTVYSRKGLVRSEPLAVCVLVDESGSMSNAEGDTTRIDAARDAAVLLAEAAGSVPGLDLFIYGHSADNITRGTTEIYTYRDHRRRERFACGNIVARWNNSDGYAILETARRVREQTRQKCLLFVVSDGQPASFAYWASAEGEEHTREAVRKVSADGFIPVHVWIGHDGGEDTMFRNVVRFNSIQSVATDLAGLIKDAVIKGSSRKAI